VWQQRQEAKVSISAIVEFLHAQEIKMNEHTHAGLPLGTCNDNVNDQGPGTRDQRLEALEALGDQRPKTEDWRPKSCLIDNRTGDESAKLQKTPGSQHSGFKSLRFRGIF